MPWSTTSSGRGMAPGFSAVRPITAGETFFRQDDHPQSITAGETLFQQDDDPQSVAFVVSGWVKTVRLERDGQERGVALYNQGSLLGLAELLARQKRPETAVTLSLSHLRWISARDFSHLIETDRGFSRQINRALGRQGYARGICLAQSGSLSLRPRLEQLLWQLLRAQSRDGATPNDTRGECKLLAPAQNRDLAQMLGVAAESFSRMLGTMEKEGVLQRRKGRLIFPEPERLWRAPEIESLVESNRGQNDQFTLADPIHA